MRRLVLRLFIGLLILLFLLVATGSSAGFWLVKTESGLQFLLKQAPRYLDEQLGQKLIVDQPVGNLWDGVEAASLSWSDGQTRVELSRLRLSADLGRLWDNVALVRHLHADKVVVSLPESQPDTVQKPEMPPSINLPLQVYLEKVSAGAIEVAGQEISMLALSASAVNNQLRISNLQLQAQGADLQLAGTLGLLQPFATSLELDIARKLEEALVLDGQIKLSGSLEELQVELDAKGQSLDNKSITQFINASAVVTPFSGAPVRSVRAQAKEFDPSLWFKQAPRAEFDLQAELRPNADFTQSKGQLSILNKKPAAMQTGGIPVSGLQAQFELALEDDQPSSAILNISRLALADATGAAGQINGVLNWNAPTQTSQQALIQAGNVQADLRAKGLRLSALTDQDYGAVLDLDLKASKSGARIQIQQLAANDRGLKLTADGRVDLLGRMESALNLKLRNLNPAVYVPEQGQASTGVVNADMVWEGVVGEYGYEGLIDPKGKLDLTVLDSRLAGAPFTAKIRATGSQKRLEKVDLQVDVLGNELDAKGSYGLPEDSVQLRLDASRLPALGKLLNLGLAGKALINGKLSGVGTGVSGNLNVDIQGLKLGPALHLSEAKGQFELGLQAQSIWSGNLVVNGLRLAEKGDELIRQMKLELSGTRTAHNLKIDVQSEQKPFSRRRAVGGSLALRGGLNNLLNGDGPVAWAGSLDALNLEGLWRPVRSLVLKKPVNIVASAGNFSVGELVLQGEDETSLISEKVVLKNGALEVAGRAPKLTLPRLRSLLKTQVTLETKDLVTSLNWSLISSPQQFDGHLDVSHVSGGFAILEDAEIDVLVNTFKVNVDVSRQALQSDLTIDAKDVGVITAGITLPVQQDAQTGAWAVASDKPLDGAVAAGITDLSWLGPLINPALRSEGDGQLAVALSGTLDQPAIDGRLFARDMDLTQIDQGIRLEDGNVVVDFTNDRARIDALEFTVYHRQAPAGRIEDLGPLIQDSGKITATGQWNLNGLNGGIDLKMSRVGLIQRPDRWLMADADITVRQPVVDGDPIKVRGLVKALGAYIELPETEPQTLGSDVVIRGQTEDSAAGAPIDVEIRAQLGDLFFLHAEGLKTRLAGGMNLVVQDGVKTASGRTGKRLEARGTIQTVDGTYRAYGQDLTIERGVVNFQGPMNNPGLNIRAVRKGVSVEAGVEITGSANRPQVTLVSDPPVPDAEKLSWMIIGRGSNSSDRDTTLLLTAAAAIFGDSEDSTTRKIAKSLGIDEFALSSGSLTAADSRAVGSQVAISPGADPSAAILGADDPLLTQRLITLGKRLNNRLYLNFEQSVTTSANVVKLIYQYSRRLSFIARGGADNAVDALYQFSFD